MSNDLENIPVEVKENLDRNGISLDVSGLVEEHQFIRDMDSFDIAAAFALHQTGSKDGAAGLLQSTKCRLDQASRKASVQRLVAVLVRSDLKSTGIKKAYDALIGIIDDDGQTANARIKAAETVLKWAGETDRPDNDKDMDDLSNMSIGELEATISKLAKKREALSKDMRVVQN